MMRDTARVEAVVQGRRQPLLDGVFLRRIDS